MLVESTQIRSFLFIGLSAIANRETTTQTYIHTQKKPVRATSNSKGGGSGERKDAANNALRATSAFFFSLRSLVLLLEKKTRAGFSFSVLAQHHNERYIEAAMRRPLMYPPFNTCTVRKACSRSANSNTTIPPGPSTSCRPGK